jgi:peptidoglycan/LPS O-acetylase OafA/YrhL
MSPSGPAFAPPRRASLDVLRGVAVLLVLARHMPIPNGLPGWAAAPLEVLARGGWMGVDLFFVLSGYLVSGLLFGEWQRHGALRAGRFLARRGFKIYPAFYVMLATVLAWSAATGRFPGWRFAVSEALFVQNYFYSLLPHTWSLAVEEHFYLALPLLLWLLRGEGERPFARLPRVAAAVLVGCLALRIARAWEGGVAGAESFVSTHLRCDALFFGVLLSWHAHFNRAALTAFVARYRRILFAAGLVLVAPAFVWELGTAWGLHTFGLTTIYLGAGCWLLLAVRRERRRRLLARIGQYSYSIYLWHVPVKLVALPLLLRSWTSPGSLLEFGSYFALAIGGGVAAALAIELPLLALRERLLPGAAPALPAPAAVAVAGGEPAGS